MSDAQYKPEYIAAVCKELETRGWQPDSRGEPDCVDEACAAGADIIKALQSRCEAAEKERDRLREALQKTMARLADYLDSDHFNNIEAIVLAAGVPYPTALAPQEPTTS